MDSPSGQNGNRGLGFVNNNSELMSPSGNGGESHFKINGNHNTLNICMSKKLEIDIMSRV